jgi:hypothetical protein
LQEIVSPLVSPRMFPQKPEWKTLPCDEILNKEMIQEKLPTFIVDEGLAEKFLEWCRKQRNKRIYVSPTMGQ